MSNPIRERRALSDYPLSLQVAASAIWGEDFWGGYDPRRRPVKPAPAIASRGRRR